MNKKETIDSLLEEMASNYNYPELKYNAWLWYADWYITTWDSSQVVPSVHAWKTPIEALLSLKNELNLLNNQ